VNRPTDPMLDALRKANPVPEESTAGWHATDEGKRVAALALVDVLESPPPTGRPTKNRMVIVLVAAVLATSAIAAGFALGSTETVEIVDPSTVACHDTLQQVAGGAIAGLKGRYTPTAACRRMWPKAFGVPAPPELTACVNYYGGIGVYPVPPSMDVGEVCRSIDAAPYSPEPTP
jgi:hypothetical protein